MKSGDEELVALAQKGDRRAFEELVDRHKQKAYHIAFDFARDREEAKDLSQDAFLKAFMNLKKFDGRSGFYTWFYRILVNVCLDYKRRQKRAPSDEFDETAMKQVEPSHQPASTDRSRPTCLGRSIFEKSRRCAGGVAGETAHGLYIEKSSRFVDPRNRRDDGDRGRHGESTPSPRRDDAQAEPGGIRLGGFMAQPSHPLQTHAQRSRKIWSLCITAI